MQVSERASQRNGAHEQSEQCGAGELVGSAWEQVSGGASGRVLKSRLYAILNRRANFIREDTVLDFQRETLSKMLFTVSSRYRPSSPSWSRFFTCNLMLGYRMPQWSDQK